MDRSTAILVTCIGAFATIAAPLAAIWVNQALDSKIDSGVQTERRASSVVEYSDLAHAIFGLGAGSIQNLTLSRALPPIVELGDPLDISFIYWHPDPQREFQIWVTPVGNDERCEMGFTASDLYRSRQPIDHSIVVSSGCSSTKISGLAFELLEPLTDEKSSLMISFSDYLLDR